MGIESREDLTYYQLYRPAAATDTMINFLAKVAHEGLEVFSTEPRGIDTQPAVVPGPDGEMEPVMRSRFLQGPRLDVYSNGQVRLPLVDLKALPDLNFRGKFQNADRRLPHGPGAHPQRAFLHPSFQHKTDAELEGQDALTILMEKIGYKYGIEKQHELQVPCRRVDVHIDPLLEHLGIEVHLVPEPGKSVTQMLKEQAGVLLRGIGRKSEQLVNPYAPTVLGIPFARMPRDTTPEQYEDFLERIGAHLERSPLVVTLGGLRSDLGGLSYNRKQRPERTDS